MKKMKAESPDDVYIHKGDLKKREKAITLIAFPINTLCYLR